MELRTLLEEDIERERDYLLDQEVGTKEYNESLKRLCTLEDKLFDLDKFEFEVVKREKQVEFDSEKVDLETNKFDFEKNKFEFESRKFESESASKEKQLKDEKKDRRIKNGIEIVKIVSGVLLPVTGLIAIMAFEKEETFTSALKGYVNCFVPKKTI